MSPELLKVVERAQREPEGQFHSLAHLLDGPTLARAFHRLRKAAAVGVDGVTKEAYGRALDAQLAELHERLRSKRYRHQALRRVHLPKERGQWRPIGISVLEDGAINGKRLNLNRFVEITATTSAKMFGLYPKKGTIAPGADADVVIFDPKKKHTLSVKNHRMRVDYSAYEGREVMGKVETVLSRGRVIIDGNAYLGKPGDGVYLKRGTSQYLV